MAREDWERRDRAIELLEEARGILEEVYQEIEDRISNMEEYFSSSPVIDQLESRKETIENAMGFIEDAISELEGME